MMLAQFWDGRAKDLKEQAGGPIANPGEMAFTHELAVSVLSSIPQYRARFKQVFGSDQVNISMVTDAIAAFEETLVTPDSRFDKWLKGDKKAITQAELDGYKLFKDSGCTSCHYGTAVGGTSFQKMGVREPYKTTSKEEGRIGVTGKATDRFVFKVPTLRNVELTYPYFHDGAVDTLEDAVDTMARVQLGRDFSKEENAKIVSFLKTLTGKQPDFKLPILPASTNETPRPTPFN
jgi:cytochrome c peroxidase